MPNYEHLKKKKGLYTSYGLSRNPFSIAPLFKEFKQSLQCEYEEKFFVLPSRLEREVQILLAMENERALIYGLYGVGKTSFVDFILYLAHNFHGHFCTRVIVTEDNVERAIQEMLLSLCLEVVSEIERKKITRPVEAVRKWIASRRYSDFLLSSVSRLIGHFTEQEETSTVQKKKMAVKISPANLGGEWGYDEEITVRKGIQSYVDVLPMRKIAEYLQDFLEIIRLIGFHDVIIFIDEADHLQKIDTFLKLLTRAREVLFCGGYNFFIAGSVELAKYTEALGAIFDKIIFLKPAHMETMKAMLECRIQALNPKKSLSDLFEEDALPLIFEKSKGIQKQFLRIAENALDEAAMAEDSKIRVAHCLSVFKTSEDEISLNLKNSQIRILRFLSRCEASSASDQKFQEETQVGRTYLRLVLEELVEQGYIRKERRGKHVYYSISSQYRAYFQQIEQ
jgi:DNA-binding MarR family transcriptional regulator